MNMSYCMFENTMRDMRQCLESMDEAETLKELDMSMREMNSYILLREFCQNFLDIAERLDGTE
jgi:hypothetical protein